MKRLFNIVAGTLAGLMLLSLILAMSVSGFLRDNPRVPDQANGYTVPLTLRGLGTRYMTEQQWDAIAPYWDFFYVMIGLFLAAILVRFVAEAYTGFMRGWRSDADGK